VRCHLRSASEALYLSHTGGKLAANVEAPCCSEELILDLGGAAATGAGGAALARTPLWSADAMQLVSLEPTTSQLVFQSQHACAGREDFQLQLHPNNELILAAAALNDESTTAPLVYSWPRVACEQGGKPTRLALELTRMPAVLVTAHGGLVSASHGRPGMGALCFLGASAASLDPATWEFEHHGDSLYSVRHAGSKLALYVGHAGALRLDGEDPPFPDPRTLFRVEMRWVEGNDGAVIAGFAIHSAFKLNGRHLSLTALPDGRVATCYKAVQPTRWELFAVVDKAAATGSAAAPLAALPAQAQEEKQATVMRRSSSCHNVLTTPPQLSRKASAAALKSASPNSTLPNIQEHSSSDDDASLDGSVHGNKAFQAGRRCASESALLQLQRGRGSDASEEPKWLADARRAPQRPSGWGIRSAATIQDSCCQALCAAVLESGADGAVDVTLPEEVRQRVQARLAMLIALPQPTKLTGAHLAKASIHGNAQEWAELLVPEGLDADDEELPEELAESCVCTVCRGSSGFLMPMDPDINPRHHGFLRAMGRRQFGGARRRRGRGGADPVMAGLQAAKHGVIVFGIFKVLAAFMR
jgi:hypothetical protein